MAQAEATTDTRNLHWKQNNVGSTLLQKMGWKQGQAIGNKRRQKEDEGEVSSEGLKIVKRPDGLGLGAANKPNLESTGHDSFHQILQNLKQEHSVESSSRKSKSKKKKRKANDDDNDEDSANSSSNKNKNKKQKKSKTSKKPRETIFATNKITNARVRESKFASKNSQDLACIFGKGYSTAEIAAQMVETTRQQQNRQQQKDKKNRKDTCITASTSSSGEGETQEQKEERRRKRKEEKEEKRRKRREEKLKSLDEC